jgi:hypothetical protein
MSNEYNNSLDHLTTVQVPRTLDNGTIVKIVYWLDGNVRGKYFIPTNSKMVMFHDASDAVAAKLIFGLYSGRTGFVFDDMK